MPTSLPLIISAISAAATAAGTGYSISQATGQHSPEYYRKIQEQAALQAKDASKVGEQRAAASTIAQGLPEIQAQTGGATTPEYNASIVGTELGVPGNQAVLLNAVSKWLGLGAGPDAGGPATTPGTSGGSTGSPGYFPHAAVPDFAALSGDTSGGLTSQQLQGGNA